MRAVLTIAAALVAAGAVYGEMPLGEDRPALHVPARPATRQELDHYEALQLFARGATAARAGRLLEAVHDYEAARRLDPDVAPIHRGLIDLYLGLDRLDDALDACRRVLDLAPDDYVTGYLYARQLRMLNKSRDALGILARVAAVPALKDRPDLLVQVHIDLALLYEETDDPARAEAAYRKAAKGLERPEVLLDDNAFNREDLLAQAAEVYERLGRVELKTGKVDRAIADFQQARRKAQPRPAAGVQPRRGPGQAGPAGRGAGLPRRVPPFPAAGHGRL